MNRRFTLVAGAGVLSLAGLVSASPSASPAPAMTENHCLTKGFLDTATKAERAACKPIVRKAFTDDSGRALSPVTKVLSVKGHDIPKNLRSGRKRRTYSRPKKGRAVSHRGNSVLARSGLTRPPGDSSPFPKAQKAHRNPKWDKNGEAIHSCAEFAYEELYDGMRFTDAVAACGGNRECELDMAYLPNTPGIAGRVLRRKDGKPIEQQIAVRDYGSMPKNDMFVFDEGYYMGVAYAGDPVLDGKPGPGGYTMIPSTPETDAIHAALEKGHLWYSFGCKGGKCGKRKFRDEWGFHRELRKRNPLSDAEFAEYEARKAEFRTLYDQWQASAGMGGQILKAPGDRATHKPLAAHTLPIDLVTSDPMDRQQMMVDQVAGNIAVGKQFGSPSSIPNLSGRAGQHGAWHPAPAPATGVLASPAPGTGAGQQVGGRKASGVGGRCSPMHWGKPGDDPQTVLNAGYVADVFGHGPAGCRIADFLKEEWRRKAKGQKSCLDVADDDCDWSPDMFHDRFVETFPYAPQDQAYEAECLDWTADRIDIPAEAPPSNPGSGLVRAEKYIDQMKHKVGVALAEVGAYKESEIQVDGQPRWRLGGKWADTESHGDKDWFAGGYDYDVGWHVQPTDLATDQVCDLSGSAHANFGVDAWVFGNDVSVLDGHILGTVNEDDSNLSHIDTSLSILTVAVPHTTFDEDFVTTWAPTPWLQTVDIPSTHPSITFMAGPVPITIAGWGGMFFGASMSASATLQDKKGTCNPKNVKFAIKGMFEPQVGLNGYAQAGVGISGVVSAGIRGELNLVTLGVPVHAGLVAKRKKFSAGTQPVLDFAADIALRLATLSGSLSLYVEVLMATDEWELFHWNGVSSRIDLMDPKLNAELPLLGWPK